MQRVCYCKKILVYFSQRQIVILERGIEMTLRDIAYIAAIQEEKSITKAANRLYIAQPALSQCVRKVENELGITLFNRTPSGVQLTAEGTCFLHFAKKVLVEQKSFERELEDMRNTNSGSLSIGFSGSQASYVLPYFLADFKKEYPAIDVQLIEASSDKIEAGVEMGNIDVSILHTPVLNQNLEYFELSRDRFVIVPRSCSKFSPHIYYKEGVTRPYMDIHFLEEEPLVLTQSWQRSRMICDQIFRKAKISPVIRQETNHIGTLDALTLVDYASTLLPEKQLTVDIRRRGYYLIDEEYDVPYSFVVCTLKGGYVSQACSKLIELLHRKQYTF